jgi:hypothetical protein
MTQFTCKGVKQINNRISLNMTFTFTIRISLRFSSAQEFPEILITKCRSRFYCTWFFSRAECSRRKVHMYDSFLTHFLLTGILLEKKYLSFPFVQFSRLHAEHKLVQNTIGTLIFFYLFTCLFLFLFCMFVCIFFFLLPSCNDWNDYRLILSVKKNP